MHKTLFVFDIETIPDTDAVRSLIGSESTDIATLREELEAYHLDVSNGNPFPRQPFHRVVAISFLEADISYDPDGREHYTLLDVRSGGTETSSEEELLRGFFHYAGKKMPRLVSYNGRTFDLPVLKYRAMKYGIGASWLHRSGDKWNNYGQKFSLNWHCDLLDAFSDFGASARCKMNEVCAIMGVPGKLETDGSQVTELFDAGKIKDIRNYCETDVLNTYLLYLTYQHHTGNIDAGEFLSTKTDVKNFLEMKESEGSGHLGEFLEAWKKTNSDKDFFKD